MALLGTVRIRLLGPLRVEAGGEAAVRFPTRKVEALFGMIALAGERGLDREVAAARLWSRSPEGQARANLRQAVALMRKALGEAAEIVGSRRDTLVIEHSLALTDTQALAQAGSPAGTLDPHWLVARGSLLEGLDLNEPAFEEWLLQERQRWMHLLSDRLAEATEAQLGAGQPDVALALGRRLVELDDFNEAAHRLVMRALLARGEDGAALRHFETVRRRLAGELGIEPGGATTALADAIRSRTVRPATAPSPDAPVAARPPPPESATPLGGDLPRTPRTELRTVVVLAGRALASATADEDQSTIQSEAAALARRQQVAEAVETRGGVVAQNTGAGFRAIFGARIAHSNDAERAVSCGLALQAAADADETLTWRLGAAAGRLLVEVAGDGEVAFVGDPLDRAEDLLRAVPDAAFVVDQHIRDATQRRFAFEPTSLETVWRVGMQDATDHRPTLTAFVGRDSEFRRVRDMIAEVASGSGGEVVLLRGEAGIGKTRLAEEIADFAGREGFRVVSVGALDFGMNRSEGLVARLSQALGSDRPEAARTVLDAAILADLTGRELGVSEREMLGTLGPAVRAGERARVLGALLEAAAIRSPLAIVVEDLHWATSDEVATLADLTAVARDLPVVFVLTTRPQGDPVDAAWRRRCAGARIGTIDLAPLRSEAARRLVTSLDALPEELVDSCVSRAQGNPLFLEHLTRSAPRLSGGRLPLSVQSVVQEELDHLPDGIREALRAAAVLGQAFSAEVLEATHDGPSTTREDLLGTGLVAPRGERLVFAHALVRDGVYASIPARDRAALHRRAASWFEGRDPVMRAEHLDRSGDPRAAEALLLAARHERQAGRAVDALRLVERALALAPAEAGDRGAEGRRLRADLLADLERFQDAIDAYAEVIGGDVSTSLAAHLGTAECLMRLDRHEEALRSLDEAEHHLGDEAADPQAAMISYLRATIQYAQGAAAHSVASAKAAQSLARRSGDRLLEARALSAMADAEQACGRFRSAERAFEACVGISNELGLRRYALINRKMCADLRFYDADFGSARALLDEVREEARALGSGRAEMLAEHMLAYVDCAEAKYDSALARAKRGRELVEALKAQRFVMNNACFAAMALYGLGRTEEALQRLTEAEAVAQSLNVTWVMPWVLGQRALCEAAPQDARRALDRAEALIRSGAGTYPLDFYPPAIDAAIRLEDWQRVQAYADALTDFFSEERVGLPDFLIRRAQLIASARLGPVDRTALAELIASAQRMGYAAALPGLQDAMARE